MRTLVILLLFIIPLPVGAEPPSLHNTIDVARRCAGLDGELDHWSGRARLRGLMPRVSAQVGGDRTDELDLTFREYTGLDADGDLLLDSTQNVSEDDLSQKLAWRVSVVWDLRDTVFSLAELPAAREERARRAERIRLDMRVTEAFRDWRSASDGDARRDAIDRLNIFTDGWFRRQLGGK